MKQQVTQAIILSRTNYDEADRILSVLTPASGKLSLMAKGARKVKSKLAGGIELFSVSDITYINGRGGVGTLTSSRLVKHYGQIVRDVERVRLGYELIKLLNRVTEDNPEAEYFVLLSQAFEALNDLSIDLDLIKVWFEAQLLEFAGNAPNLTTDNLNQALRAEASYNFDFETMAFSPSDKGEFKAAHIKALRLFFSGYTPHRINQVSGVRATLPGLKPLTHNMLALAGI